MTTSEQAFKLLALAKALNNALAEPEILADTFGVNSSLGLHLEGKVFVQLAKLTEAMAEATIETHYDRGSMHGTITVGNVQFQYCHNLI